MAGPSLSLDPDKFERDWRKVVRAGAFVILLSLGVMALAAPVSLAAVGPVEKKLEKHLAETNDQDAINCALAENIMALCHATGAICKPMAGCAR